VGVRGTCSICGGTGWRVWKELKREHFGVGKTNLAQMADREQDEAVENFMAQHFRERDASREKEFEVHAEYVKRFYSTKCDWTRWLPYPQDVEAVVNVLAADGGRYVFTKPTSRPALRYDVRPSGKDWLIWHVAMECLVCFRRGRSDGCFWCGGTIWERKDSGSGLGGGARERGETPPENPRWQP